MANISSIRLLSFSLIGLGLLALLLSIVAASLGASLGPDDHCEFCFGWISLIAAGVVNAILSFLPISIGLIGVYAKKNDKIFGGFSIFFFILAFLNMGGLVILGGLLILGGGGLVYLAVVYFCILIIIYLVEIIISAVCMYKMKFSCCGKTEEDDGKAVEIESIQK